jgi:hypothetical protein
MNRSIAVACFSLAIVGAVALVASRVLSHDKKSAAEAPAVSVKPAETTNTPHKQVLESEGASAQEPRDGLQPKGSAVDVPAPSALTEEDALRKKYEDLKYEELAAKQAELQRKLSELSMPVFDDYFKRGLYEAVGTGQKYTPDSSDSSQLMQVRVPGKNAEDQRVIKIVIPEKEHPDLVAMHREDIWLTKELRKLPRPRPR